MKTTILPAVCTFALMSLVNCGTPSQTSQNFGNDSVRISATTKVYRIETRKGCAELEPYEGITFKFEKCSTELRQFFTKQSKSQYTNIGTGKILTLNIIREKTGKTPLFKGPACKFGISGPCPAPAKVYYKFVYLGTKPQLCAVADSNSKLKDEANPCNDNDDAHLFKQSGRKYRSLRYPGLIISQPKGTNAIRVNR